MNSEENIQRLSNTIFEMHQKQSQENPNLKVLEKRRKDVYKGCQNILKAIEQGIITDMTKERLTDLENQLAEIEIDIAKEKSKDFSLLTKDEIETFLRKHIFEKTDNIKIRKLLINTMVRDVFLYEDSIVVTLNFATPPTKPSHTMQENIQTEKQIASAFSLSSSSCFYPLSAPEQKNCTLGSFCHKLQKHRLMLVFLLFAKISLCCDLLRLCEGKALQEALETLLCDKAQFTAAFFISPPCEKRILLCFIGDFAVARFR